MGNYDRFFTYTNYQIEQFFVYFVFAAGLALYLVVKSDSKYKIELFFISFYLITGNINDLLEISIPGVGFFKIPPERFMYLMLSILLIRRKFFSRKETPTYERDRIPWFVVALYAYVILQTIAIFVNVFPSEFKSIIDTVAFLIIIYAFRYMEDRPSYNLIGKSIIIGAIITSVVGVIQFSVDPYFLRMGDARGAFGNVLRSNGIFSTEYFHSYYVIIAIVWVLTTIKKGALKFALIALFSMGVITSFMRMSWIILFLVIVSYLIFIQKVAIEKLVLIGLSSLTLMLSVSIFYYRDIMNSTLVKERLSDSVDGRKGYYTMVIDNIGKKPVFGYGNLKNEVYYENLLRITRDRERATAETGDLHSGYFSILFLYGIPAFVCFSLFIILSVIYYSRSYKQNLYFIIPFLVSIIYMVGNLTNNFIFLKYISVLYAIHIGIGMGINRIDEQSEKLKTVK